LWDSRWQLPGTGATRASLFSKLRLKNPWDSHAPATHTAKEEIAGVS